jgi:hypothetical protein
MMEGSFDDADTQIRLTSSNEVTRALQGKVLVRCKGYSIVDTAPDALPGKGYFIRSIQVVPLDQLSVVIDSLISELRAESTRLEPMVKDGSSSSQEPSRGDLLVGFIPSSIEVIQHLQKLGYNPVASVPEAAPRIAVITSFMVKTKRNPIQDRSVFFVGVAEYPQKRKRNREEL